MAAADADGELNDLGYRAEEQQHHAKSSRQHPRTPHRNVVMLQAPGHAKEARHVKRHEGDVKAEEAEPERPFAPVLVQFEAEGFREPVSQARQSAEKNGADDNVVKVGDQEHALMNKKVGRRHRQQNAGHAADHKGDDEADGPEHSLVFFLFQGGRAVFFARFAICQEGIHFGI